MEQISQGCPALDKLTLGMDGAQLPSGILKPLRKHTSLQQLSIGSVSLSDADIIALATFSNLKHVHLHPDISKDVLEVLQTLTISRN